ncbi:zf-TFIIB domain-containing protein [Amycolatopsis acidiphila]|nr:zf-TFIIB domain-containing protein [Amycolatopsis acidiphila]GHG82729.1 transcriptional regulator [Amycolatopsis acidiphila]
MRTVDKNGVHLEQCEGCRGIFLDRGELEQIAGAESAYYGSPAPYPGPAPSGVAPPYRGGHDDSPGPYRGHGDSPRPFRGHSDSPRPYRGGYGDSSRPYQGGGAYYGDSPRPYRGHRKRSFLENLFD